MPSPWHDITHTIYIYIYINIYINLGGHVDISRYSIIAKPSTSYLQDTATITYL